MVARFAVALSALLVGLTPVSAGRQSASAPLDPLRYGETAPELVA